jgi:hypothetical protein
MDLTFSSLSFLYRKDEWRRSLTDWHSRTKRREWKKNLSTRKSMLLVYIWHKNTGDWHSSVIRQ